MRVILLAPPGAGKGTQSERISARYGVPHISSGDIFREETALETPAGKRLRGYLDSGDLVPDDLVLSLIKDRVVAAVRQEGGYVLDGFPRTLAQAEATAEIGRETQAGPQAVVYLDAPQEVLLARISGRGEQDGRGGQGESRADDSDEVARHRLDVYTRSTLPLIDYYAGRGLVIRVDAAPGVETVSQEIFTALDRIQ